MNWDDWSYLHDSDEDAGDCKVSESLPIVVTRDDIGFRCCADAVVKQRL